MSNNNSGGIFLGIAVGDEEGFLYGSSLNKERKLSSPQKEQQKNTLTKSIHLPSLPGYTIPSDIIDMLELTHSEKDKVTITEEEIRKVAILISMILLTPKGEAVNGNRLKHVEGIKTFLSDDLFKQIEREIYPDNHGKSITSITEKIQTILRTRENLDVYVSQQKIFKSRVIKFMYMQKAYASNTLYGKKLTSETKSIIGRQIIREIQHFSTLLKTTINDIHNIIAKDGRSYTQADRELIENCEYMLYTLQELKTQLIGENYNIAVQSRVDQIREDADILKGKRRKKAKKDMNIAGESRYILPSSRETLIFGDTSSKNYIMAALRNGKNVELLGPTGTGKTSLALECALRFTGKYPITISGGPGVARRDFYGSAKGLDSRYAGAIERCLKEGKILYIDEDNRIDPRQIAEIKFLLGLKSGDTFIHPDTGESLVIPPEFRVMVSRNEKGKHHTDRYDLPPDYRREFTLGSFEVDYFTPEEMYERFLIPKLINDDGSISLSKEEIGGNKSKNEYSPLLSLVEAAKQIQEKYKSNELQNAVFESGYLIEVLDQWKEIQFKKNKNGENITFIQYLEEKLMEFIKRPIGNKDRKIIIEALIAYGFFKDTPREAFATANEGLVFGETEKIQFENLKKVSTVKVFQTPSKEHLSSYEVALLDPYDTRKIRIPSHPLEKEIKVFNDLLRETAALAQIAPVIINTKNIDFETTRDKIASVMLTLIKNSGKETLIKALIVNIQKMDTEEYIQEITKLINTLG